MNTSPNESSSDPAVHCENLRRELNVLADHLRRDITRVSEPQFKASCETSAEVIGALRTSFEHYSAHSEPAWQGQGSARK
ncbi:MAG TPA: hypothetical protein VFJ90_13690 [Candidatus Didemnitutus sp.]|nr:hypothetical protein [Candidatus Didemnitutus sp.]